MTDSIRRGTPGSILGTRVVRTEDPELLTGTARYVNDLDLPGKLHAAFARSEVAHAELRAVHVDDAIATPGVVAVFTAADLGVAPHHGFVTVHPDFARPPLADGVVRFVGEAIAIVIAETVAAAADGAAAVWADYAPLPAITDPEAAFADGAPIIFPAHGSNQALVATDADPIDLDANGDGDVVVVRGRYVNQRMAVVPMEPNSAAAVPVRRRPADVLRVEPDAAHGARPARWSPRHRRRPDQGHRPPGGRRLRGQARPRPRVLRRRRRGAAPRSGR